MNPATPDAPKSRPYPETWEQVAELRVFRATSQEWASLIQWRREMQRKGWKLLRVTTERGVVRCAVLVFAAGTAVGLFACAGAGAGPSPEASPPAGGTAAIPFATDTAHYRVASHLTVEQEVNGQKQYGGVELVYYLTVLVARQGERLHATLVLDSIPRYAGPAAVDPTAPAARGAVFRGILTPAGELGEFQARDSSVRFVRELMGELKNFFPRVLPAGALTGQRWVDTTEQQATSSMVPLTMRFVGEHEVGEPDASRGMPALPIRSNIGYTFSGTGSQGGQEFRVDGTGRRAVTEYLGLDGRYLGLAGADSSTFTITLPAVGMSIPGRQTRADTVTVAR